MVTKATTPRMASRMDISREDTTASASWGYWGLAVGVVLVTLGLLYGSYFFLLS